MASVRSFVDVGPNDTPSGAGARKPTVRTVFWFFLLITIAGVVVYSAIGITHK
jgi:hypothetical protein